MLNSHATKYEKQISQFKYEMLIKTSDVFNKVPTSKCHKQNDIINDYEKIHHCICISDKCKRIPK